MDDLLEFVLEVLGEFFAAVLPPKKHPLLYGVLIAAGLALLVFLSYVFFDAGHAAAGVVMALAAAGAAVLALRALVKWLRRR